MSTVPQQVDGSETLAGDNGALDALVSFYRAFNAGDLDALALNWAEGDSPSMDNPIGGIRRGWPSIAQGYAKLFGGPATVHVAFHDFTSQGTDDWHLFVGREKGRCEAGGKAMDLRIRTTRWFVKQDGRWRQLHHHGSIEEPAQLADYQTMIFGAPLVQPA